MIAEVKGRAEECWILSGQIRTLVESLNEICDKRSDGVLTMESFMSATSGICQVLAELSGHMEAELRDLLRAIQAEDGASKSAAAWPVAQSAAKRPADSKR